VGKDHKEREAAVPSGQPRRTRPGQPWYVPPPEARAARNREAGLARHGNPLPVPGLRGARRAAGLTQAALAAKAGLFGAVHVSTLERGMHAATAGTRTKLAAALGVTEDVLRQPGG
jgi:hypothetical protein